MKRRELNDEEKAEAARLSQAWLDYKATHKGVTQEWLGAESGLGTQGAVGQYLRGVIPLNLEALIAICRVIEAVPAKISPRLGSLLNAAAAGPTDPELDAFPPGTARRVRVAEDNDPEFLPIPMVKLRLQAGVTGYQTDPDRRGGGTIGMRRTWIERSGLDPARLIAIQVRGESMEPALYEDDIVVINITDKKLIDGEVYAVNYEGESVVKRLSRDAGEWWLTSDNPDKRKYHRKICRGDACIVIGRVVRKESDRI